MHSQVYKFHPYTLTIHNTTGTLNILAIPPHTKSISGNLEFQVISTNTLLSEVGTAGATERVQVFTLSLLAAG